MEVLGTLLKEQVSPLFPSDTALLLVYRADKRIFNAVGSSLSFSEESILARKIKDSGGSLRLSSGSGMTDEEKEDFEKTLRISFSHLFASLLIGRNNLLRGVFFLLRPAGEKFSVREDLLLNSISRFFSVLAGELLDGEERRKNFRALLLSLARNRKDSPHLEEEIIREASLVRCLSEKMFFPQEIRDKLAEAVYVRAIRKIILQQDNLTADADSFYGILSTAGLKGTMEDFHFLAGVSEELHVKKRLAGERKYRLEQSVILLAEKFAELTSPLRTIPVWQTLDLFKKREGEFYHPAAVENLLSLDLLTVLRALRGGKDFYIPIKEAELLGAYRLNHLYMNGRKEELTVREMEVERLFNKYYLPQVSSSV